MLALARKPFGVSRAEASMARFQNWGAVEKRADTEGTFKHLWVLSTWHRSPPSGPVCWGWAGWLWVTRRGSAAARLGVRMRQLGLLLLLDARMRGRAARCEGLGPCYPMQNHVGQGCGLV